MKINKYYNRIIMCFKMTLSKNESYLWWTKSNNKRRETPLPTGLQPTKEWSKMEDNDRRKFEDLDNRSCIGSLIYLMAGTRYDIAYSVTKLAKFVNNPRSKHFYALVWLLQYLRSNSEYGIIYYNDYTKSHVYEIMTK